MIFASDLDRTLIYTKKHFENIDINKIRLVEIYNGKEIAFMTNDAVKELKILSKEVYFVPVTTRTVDQYRRINIFQEEIIPNFAITSNGGNVLIGDKVDREWKNIVKSKLNNECSSFDDVIFKFNKISSDKWIISKNIADELFYHFMIDENNISLEEMNFLTMELKKENWDVFLHGRKLYLIPCCVNKWDAVEYVKNKIGIDSVAASGDSMMDLCMLQNADYSISPSHGEINQKLKKKDFIKFTEKTGILAGEEIISKVRLLTKNALA